MGRIRHRTATAAVITTTLLVAATWAATLPGADAIAQDREEAAPSAWGDGETPAEGRADRPLAAGRGLDTERGVVVETDLVTMRAEEERAAVLDRVTPEIEREVALERARREAPFDLSWGLEP